MYEFIWFGSYSSNVLMKHSNVLSVFCWSLFTLLVSLFLGERAPFMPSSTKNHCFLLLVFYSVFLRTCLQCFEFIEYWSLHVFLLPLRQCWCSCLSIWIKASRCAWLRIMILIVYVSTTVFITQGNCIGYMFRPLNSNRQACSYMLSHRMLCTHWDPSVFTSVQYLSQIISLWK